MPTVRCWLRRRSSRPALFLEPFAGGGIVGLTAGFERLADHVHLVELDVDVAAVWQTILSVDSAWLAQRITGFGPAPESVKAALDAPFTTTRDRAFATILRNRVYHGGILAPGSGLLKQGENGKGLTSRWYPETLARRITDIWEIRDRFRFTHGDGIAALAAIADREDVVAFIDPPYTSSRKRAGSRLYTDFSLDHEALFATAATMRGEFLMTYDDDAAVEAMALRHGFAVARIPMKNTHHARMYELLIGRDLRWLLPAPAGISPDR